MSALTKLTLAGALDGLAKREFTSVELTKAHIEAVEAARPLNAFVLETPEKAIEMAKGFGGQSSPRFVNGVLGTVYRERIAPHEHAHAAAEPQE